MSANTHTVFIFGAPDINLDSEPENNIPELVKLEFYNPINEIHKYFKQPMVVRYLMDSEFIIRCWGCHRLINDYAYPHNFTGRQQDPVIVLCCSHLCPLFIKYYKKSNQCLECGSEFIPHSATIHQLTNNQALSDHCPCCLSSSWTTELKTAVYRKFEGKIQPHLIDIIYKFIEKNTALNNNKLLVSHLDT